MTAPSRIKLKSGLELFCINPVEAAYLADEADAYFRHGISLQKGARVLDVGANVGVFSARVFEQLEGEVEIFAFEPLPPIHAVLDRNANEVLGRKVKVFPHGIAAKEAEIEFAYFPLLTGWSSMCLRTSDLKAETERQTNAFVELIREGRIAPELKRLPSFILKALVKIRVGAVLKRRETHRARVRPLSIVIEEQGIAVIDLLKIDVEGAELEVLKSIEDAHWPRIQQAVIEVEQWSARREPIGELLESKGFRVEIEHDSVQQAADIGMIYAVRSVHQRQ